jgi:hypothetical protein
MKHFITLLSFCCLQIIFSQNLSKYNVSIGSNVEYAFSGKTNTVFVGPVLMWEPKETKNYHQALDVNIGLAWSDDDKNRIVTSAGFYKGSLPGIMFGISSQQYYNVKTKHDTYKTDIRLSGEVIFALFGVIGYRYQHPVQTKNEASHISRHAFFIKIPIPLKKLSRK